MTDYECPSCGGGFPATAAADDECPWCGREMGASRDTGIGAPIQTVPTNRTSTLTDSTSEFGDALGDWQQSDEQARDDLRTRRNSRDTLLESEL